MSLRWIERDGKMVLQQQARAWTGNEMGMVFVDVPTHQEPKKDSEAIYPCLGCGVMRTKAEGGTTFTVCDDCWDKQYPKRPKKMTVEDELAKVLWGKESKCGAKDAIAFFKARMPIVSDGWLWNERLAYEQALKDVRQALFGES